MRIAPNAKCQRVLIRTLCLVLFIALQSHYYAIPQVFKNSNYDLGNSHTIGHIYNVNRTLASRCEGKKNKVSIKQYTIFSERKEMK